MTENSRPRLRYVITAPLISIILCALIVMGGVFACYTLIRNAKQDHMELVTALAKPNQEAVVLKLIDEKMTLPMETKVTLARTICSMATLKKLPVSLICGVIDVETGRTWKHTLTSPMFARGLMQLMWSTAKPHLRAERVDPVTEVLFDPVTNVIVGITVLADCREQAQEAGLESGKSYGVTLAMYNGGPRANKPNEYSKLVEDATKKFEALGL